MRLITLKRHSTWSKVARREVLWLSASGVVVAFTAWNSDAFAAGFIGLSSGLVLIAGRVREMMTHHWLSDFVLVAAVSLFWFSSVDRYATVEFCQRCPIHHFQRDYRFLGMSVYVELVDEHDPLVAQIASDLGRPCVHEYFGFALARRWGLVYYRGYSSCMCCTAGPDYDYERTLRPGVLQLAKTQPNLKDEFYDRVVLGDDWKYLHALLDSLKGR